MKNSEGVWAKVLDIGRNRHPFYGTIFLGLIIMILTFYATRDVFLSGVVLFFVLGSLADQYHQIKIEKRIKMLEDKIQDMQK
ncbi:MAG: hypothetical protein HQL25_07245 [Candidatus Omnitrophica bacterium]|nr:hypothetical protein [Candidatus Omnitrophota bacterium]